MQSWSENRMGQFTSKQGPQEPELNISTSLQYKWVKRKKVWFC